MTISSYSRSCLNMQGFTALDDEAKSRFNFALRFTPALCFPLTVAGVVFQSGWWLGALALSAGAAVILPGGHPFDYVYNYGLRRLIGAPRLPRNPRPRRFAFLMAAVMLAASAVSFAAGAVVLGWLFGVTQLLGCGVYLFGGLCVGSFVYSRAFGPAPEPARLGAVSVSEVVPSSI